ncbi:GDSL esterase/lipase [Striga hermonthica]|uniref:GDSL esterase/lipase n=1 Tax=Striga hermonthica TaxID=68872 RepID=A0A9N7RKF7_STRHE|nr:GDSL esterase/lipase [Striga hermonthica]
MKAQMHSTVFTIVCLHLAIQIGTSSAEGWNCPFDYLYHWGDGVTDIGNSIHVLPKITIPAGRKPYGMTYPGFPTGRWSDGLVDFDFSAEDFGLPNIQPYLNMSQSKAASYDGVIFSVAGSPVLHRKFFELRDIVIPPYAVPLNQQMHWFRKHLKYVCHSPSGPDLVNRALKTCCGIGGKYNFDPKRFCSHKGVPVCSNPDEYVFWDGMHFTQEAQMRVEKSLIVPALQALNCTQLETTDSYYTDSWATTYIRASDDLASM